MDIVLVKSVVTMRGVQTAHYEKQICANQVMK